MSSTIKKINDSNFDSAVLFPRKPAVVFFTADWSDASRAVHPILDAAALKYRSKAAVYEMNTDENSIIPIAYGVRRVPAVLTFAGGRLEEAYFGSMTKEKLDEKIEKITSPGDFYKTVAETFKKTAMRARYRIALLLSELF